MKKLFLLFSILLTKNYTFCDYPAYFLFAHGIADSWTQAYKYTPENNLRQPNKHYIIQQPCIDFNFPDSSHGFLKINFPHSSLAQANEIICLQQHYQKALRLKNPENPLIIMGLSRGASTVINFVGLFKPKQISALILESPFDSMRTIVEYWQQKIHMQHRRLLTDFFEGLVGLVFMQYKKNIFRPIDAAKLISPDIPVLLVCSEQDTTVPAYSTAAIYKTLRSAGHTKCHLLQLPYGKHAHIIEHQCGNTYQNVVHAFYRKYNLPHNSVFADAGEAIFKTTQPIIL